ncbi:MAG: CehA/McbA family metallohydrolase [Myxococcota bacterium]
MASLRFVVWVGVGAAGALASGCDDGDGGAPGACSIEVGTLDATGERPFPDGIGGEGDLRVRTDVLTAVFSDVDRPAHIAASGGTLVDLSLDGGDDHMNEYSQIAGASQSLQVRYTEMEVVEQDDRRAVVESRGFVQPQPVEAGEAEPVQPDPGTDIELVTQWEMRCGDPRVHLRSTLTNTGSQSYQTGAGWGIMDVMFWGTRSLEPFCPVSGQGEECTPFDIDNPAAGLVVAPYLGATGSLAGEPGTFAFYADDPEVPRFIGVHDDQVSAFGFPNLGLQSLEPGQSLSLGRAIVVGDDADAASATDLALEAVSERSELPIGTVTGRVQAPDGGFSDNPYDRPTVLLATPPETGDATDPETWSPITLVRVAEDGRFEARVPAGPISWELRAPGRPTLAMEGGTVESGGTRDLGELPLPPAPELRITVRDTTGGDTGSLPARVVVVGTDGTPDPDFGPTPGGSPLLNVALTDGEGDVSLPVPEGTYDVYATHGPFWSLDVARDVTVTPDGADVALELEALDVLPPGFVSADFHVHSAASMDSSLPIADRVRAFLAEGVDAIVSTEHDVLFDYAPALATVESDLPPPWRGRLRTFVGLESTASIPWDQFIHTIGHHNAFPLTAQPGAHKNGAPVDEYIDVGTLYERLRAVPSPIGEPVVQLNHARASRAGSIWLGYFDSCGFSPTAPLDPDGDCFGSMGPTGTRPWAFDTMEVINGKSAAGFVNMKRDWYALLRQAPGGRLPVGTANSDSHRLVADQAGYPVTVLHTGGDVDALDDQTLVDTLRSGAVSGGAGVFVWAVARPAESTTGEAEPGDTLSTSGDVDLEITVAAAPWVSIEEIRVLSGGVIVDRLAPDTTPADPFGATDVVRFADTVTVPAPAGDTFLTVEAGFTQPPLADTDDDGQVEVDPGPSPEPLGTIAPGLHPMGFTNPIYVDADDDGLYDPPETPLPE